ncbi:MAG: hypothetical protein ABSF90_19425 [Syntrophobacteraceae bacterium]|jgi:hypothetical protein
MYRRYCFAVAAVCLVGIPGLVVILTPLGLWLEQEVGVDILFHLRGPGPVRPALLL